MLTKTTDILTNEAEIALYIQQLTSADIKLAEDFCTAMLLENAYQLSSSKAVSSAYARCVIRFLLDKKTKSQLTNIIASNAILRTGVFGQLNTYKYSLIWIMKRVFRLNNISLTTDIMELLSKNPFRDDSAPGYSERWSLQFLIDEVLSAPEDYLNLSEESRSVIDLFK